MTACGRGERGCGSLYQREDDRPETVRRRLYTYYKETGPLIGYYYAQDLLVEIDGEQGIDEVQAELVAAQYCAAACNARACAPCGDAIE